MNWKIETPQDRLPLYEAILKDWLVPIEECDNNYTNDGFCCSIQMNQGINVYGDYFKTVLPELYRQRKTDQKDDWFHYDEHGRNPQGRADRVAALRAAIRETKEAIEKEKSK